MRLVIGFGEIALAIVLLTVALTGDNFATVLTGHADASNLKTQPGA